MAMRRKKLIGPAEWPGRPLVVVDGVCVCVAAAASPFNAQPQTNVMCVCVSERVWHRVFGVCVCVCCQLLPSFSTSALRANTGAVLRVVTQLSKTKI